MATTYKKRLNITLSQEVEDALALLAERDAVPRATKAAELLRIAIELEEDLLLGYIAKKRDATPDNEFISHDEVWSQ